MKRAEVVLVLLLVVAGVGCRGKSVDRSRYNTIHSRIDEVQRAISQLTRKSEITANEVMVLQDQMETTRIQVQKIEHHGPVKKNGEEKKGKEAVYFDSTECGNKKRKSKAVGRHGALPTCVFKLRTARS